MGQPGTAAEDWQAVPPIIVVEPIECRVAHVSQVSSGPIVRVGRLTRVGSPGHFPSQSAQGAVRILCLCVYVGIAIARDQQDGRLHSIQIEKGRVLDVCVTAIPERSAQLLLAEFRPAPIGDASVGRGEIVGPRGAHCRAVHIALRQHRHHPVGIIADAVGANPLRVDNPLAYHLSHDGQDLPWLSLHRIAGIYIDIEVKDGVAACRQQVRIANVVGVVSEAVVVVQIGVYDDRRQRPGVLVKTWRQHQGTLTGRP